LGSFFFFPLRVSAFLPFLDSQRFFWRFGAPAYPPRLRMPVSALQATSTLSWANPGAVPDSPGSDPSTPPPSCARARGQRAAHGAPEVCLRRWRDTPHQPTQCVALWPARAGLASRLGPLHSERFYEVCRIPGPRAGVDTRRAPARRPAGARAAAPRPRGDTRRCGKERCRSRYQRRPSATSARHGWRNATLGGESKGCIAVSPSRLRGIHLLPP
jgi:hypothetical protein